MTIDGATTNTIAMIIAEAAINMTEIGTIGTETVVAEMVVVIVIITIIGTTIGNRAGSGSEVAAMATEIIMEIAVMEVIITVTIIETVIIVTLVAGIATTEIIISDTTIATMLPHHR